MGVGCSARGGRFAVPGSSDLTRRAADACSTDRGLALRNESSALRCDSLGSLQGRGRLFHGPEILLEPARHTGQTCRAGGLCVARVTRGSTWNGWPETKAVARALPNHRRVRKRRQRRMALVGSCSGERGRVHGNVRLERTAMFHVERQSRKRTGLGGGQKKKGDCATCIVQQRARANGAMSLLDMPCLRCIKDPEAQLAPRLTFLRVPMARERLPSGHVSARTREIVPRAKHWAANPLANEPPASHSACFGRGGVVRASWALRPQDARNRGCLASEGVRVIGPHRQRSVPGERDCAMNLPDITVTDRRGIDHTERPLASELNLLWGDSGSVKITLLEAIFPRDRGQSFRIRNTKVLIQGGKDHLKVIWRFADAVSRTSVLGFEATRTATVPRTAGQSAQSLAELSTVFLVQIVEVGVRPLGEKDGYRRRRRCSTWNLGSPISELVLPARSRNATLHLRLSKAGQRAGIRSLARLGEVMADSRRLWVSRLRPCWQQSVSALPLDSHYLGAGGTNHRGASATLGCARAGTVR